MPGSLLDQSYYGNTSYEQEYFNAMATRGLLPACQGATLIAVNHLLDNNGDWIDKKFKVPRTTSEAFENGEAFWTFFLKELLWRHGSWSEDSLPEVEHPTLAFRRLTLCAGGITGEEWKKLQKPAGLRLNDDGTGHDEADDQLAISTDKINSQHKTRLI